MNQKEPPPFDSLDVNGNVSTKTMKKIILFMVLLVASSIVIVFWYVGVANQLIPEDEWLLSEHVSALTNSSDDVYLNMEKLDKNSEIRVNFCNKLEREIRHGYAYEVEIKKGDSWYKHPLANTKFQLIGLGLAPGEIYPMVFEEDELYYPNIDHYRIIKQYDQNSLDDGIAVLYFDLDTMGSGK